MWQTSKLYFYCSSSIKRKILYPVSKTSTCTYFGFYNYNRIHLTKILCFLKATLIAHLFSPGREFNCGGVQLTFCRFGFAKLSPRFQIDGRLVLPSQWESSIMLKPKIVKSLKYSYNISLIYCIYLIYLHDLGRETWSYFPYQSTKQPLVLHDLSNIFL